MEAAQPAWAICARAVTLTAQRWCSLMSRKNLLCFPLWLLTLVLTQGTTGKRLALFSLYPPSPWAVLSLGCMVPVLSGFPLRKDAPVHHFFGFCWSFSSMPVLLLYWGTQKWREYSRCVSPVLSWGTGSLACCLSSCRRANIYFKIYLNYYT